MDNFFGHIPTSQNSAAASLSTSVQAVTANAQALNIPRVVIEAFQASVKQGVPVRGEVVRENKDGSLRVRTREGTIDIQPQPRNNASKASTISAQQQGTTQQSATQAAANHGQSAAAFKAGDIIRLDFPVDAFSSAKKANFLLQITAERSMPQGAPPLPHAGRISHTPLHIQLSGQPQSNTQNAVIPARLEAVSPQNLDQVLRVHHAQNFINSSAQSIENKLNINFDTPRPNTGSPLSSSTTPHQIPAQSAPLISSLQQQQNQSVTLLALSKQTNGPQSALLSTSLSTRGDSQPIPPQNSTAQPVTTNSTAPNSTATSFRRFNILPQNFTLQSAQLIPPQNTQPTAQLLPSGLSTPITQNQSAGHNIATVIGFTKNGSPVVSVNLPQASQTAPATASPLPLGQVNSTANLQAWGNTNQVNFYILRAPDLAIQNLSIGSQLEISPQGNGQAAAAQTGIPAGTLSGNPFAILPPGLWPSLSEAQQALHNIDPHLSQVLNNMTPAITSTSSPAKMMPAALFFVAAMRSGDIQGWLGDKAIDALRRMGKGDLLTRLGQEGQAINRVNAEPLSNDWRALNLPFLYEGDMHTVALYYRHDEPQNEDESGEKRTRFVFDLSLPRMGNVQIDGLFRAKQLDLVVRATESFSADMRQHMRQSYTHILEASGLSGELSFQNDYHSFVTPKPKIDEFEAQF